MNKGHRVIKGGACGRALLSMGKRTSDMGRHLILCNVVLTTVAEGRVSGSVAT